MSGSSKFWIGDKMYLVDDEVYEYFEQLQAENGRLKEEARSWRRVAEKLEGEKQALKGGD